MALVAASTVSMMSDHIVLRRLLGDPNNDSAGCNIAAGRDPGGTFWGSFTALAGRNAEALKACAEPFQIAWWAPIVVVGTVFALAAVLCWATPLWKIRRRGLLPVAPSLEALPSVASRELYADRARCGTRSDLPGPPPRSSARTRVQRGRSHHGLRCVEDRHPVCRWGRVGKRLGCRLGRDPPLGAGRSVVRLGW
ncbi:MAG TPA: hypothetical protein VK735_34955 [Pseudonocardia sp.]|uniref:hypothetical protein n=1 Tax=Pseudonocardia sp. TaxID=60912 RepID=UPI002B88730D|nr:hypothetical protein [Pseudonocardia sp.]HTF52676.1 hypothetical protein [Pseudonocardia sp.]